MRELYINNQLCDIDGEFNPTFQYKSFLFAKMQGYEAARTWEVSIPLTARNRAIIQQSQSADSASTFPYTTHTVSYYSEGYPIVENGRAYMVGISDNRVRFVFVIGETIQVLKELGEKKLRELTETSADKLAWNRSVSFNDMSSGFGWCNWFSFTNQDRTLPSAGNVNLPFGVVHPVVTLPYIMSKIEAFFGITFIGLSSMLAGCAFPLTDIEGKSTIANIASTTGGTPSGSGLSGFPRVPFANFSSPYLSLNEPNGSFIRIDYGIDYIHIYTFTARYSTASGDFPVTSLTLNAADSKGDTRTIAVCGKSVGSTVITFTLGGYFNILPSDKYLYFQFSGGTFGFIDCTLLMEAQINQNYYSSITTGGFYPIIPNLPDMTCSEFINQCTMIAGVFPFVDHLEPTKIKFFSAAELIDNKANALDWSKYLVKESFVMSETDNMEYALDSFAQNNVMRYADYPENSANNTGILTCENENIPLSSDFFKLFFADGRRSANSTIVDYPIYDVSIEGGELIRRYNKPNVQILGKVQNIAGINYLTFPDSLKFSTIKAGAEYSAIQAIITKPRIQQCKFQLTPRLMADIDVTVPIYIEQYGKYYAIMEAQIDGEYNADVTLLEI